MVAAGPGAARLSVHLILRRSLSVDSTQKVTLGVIVAYAVVIALLWNLPYVRWSLWPFKVSSPLQSHGNVFIFECLLTIVTDARHSLPRIRPRDNSLLYRRTGEIDLSRST